MAFVYWIHLPEHTDMFTEGYVGITSKTVDYRFRRHKNAAASGSRLIIHNAIRKYGESVVVDTILSGSIAYCKDVEYKLRPTPNIGWNIGVGGQAVTLGVTPTDEARAKIAAAAKKNKSWMKAAAGNVGRKQSDDEKERRASKLRGARRSEASKELMRIGNAQKKPWQMSKTNLAVLAKALDAFELFLVGESCKRTEILLQLPPQSLRHTYVKFKSGWNPKDDPEYILWREVYKLKECYGTQTISPS